MCRHHHHHGGGWRDGSYLIGGMTRLGWLQCQTPGPHCQPEADRLDSYWPRGERLVRRVAPSCLSHGIRPDPMPSLDVKVIRPASAAVKIVSIVDPRFRVLGGVLQQRLLGLQQLMQEFNMPVTAAFAMNRSSEPAPKNLAGICIKTSPNMRKLRKILWRFCN